LTLALGIDTGGTYTDAVLVDHESGDVIASAKALTTYRDLSLGIGQAVTAVLTGRRDVAPGRVGLVSLSTTLATNAIVEGRGSPITLVLIGYDTRLIRQYGFERELVTDDVVYLAGGHDGRGDELQPLDEGALRQAVLARRDKVEAFAVSSFFSVRNPAHELRARAVIEELTGLPVTCRHELTTRLNSVRRATTTALNARLIPLLKDLIGTVQSTLSAQGIEAPLMVVRGDGSLMRSDWALRRPIETILSGPAASVVGAWHLARHGDVWVVDVGGTTTDIAALLDGRPKLSPDGAQVGRWRTMVEAADVRTVGLGGDSEVLVAADGRFSIGPRRVVPLCLLAQEYPDAIRELERQTLLADADGRAAGFAFLQRETEMSVSRDDESLLESLGSGAKSLVWLAEHFRYGSLTRRLQRLERQRLVMRSGFTPTDALHVLGRLSVWNRRASELGAELLASHRGISVQEFCQEIVEGVSARVTTELVTKVLSDEALAPDWEREGTAAAMLERALGRVPSSDLGCDFKLGRPVVAIGAPATAYLPRVADQLHTDVYIPPHADVANAVGAVAGGVVQQARVTIRPLHGEEDFRLYLDDGVHDFCKLDDATDYAQGVVERRLEQDVGDMGAEQVEIRLVRTDHSVPVALAWGQNVYIGTELTFTAAGRPRVAVKT